MKQPKCTSMDNKENVVNTSNGLLSNLKTEENSDTRYNIDKPWVCYAKQKPGTRQSPFEVGAWKQCSAKTSKSNKVTSVYATCIYKVFAPNK